MTVWDSPSRRFLKAFTIILLIFPFLYNNDAVAKDKRIEAYDAKGRRDLGRDLVIRDGKVYQSDRRGRVLHENGSIRLKDGEEFDGQGRKTGRHYKLY
ncbi:MAG: hypothetical protein CVV06_06735 [Gammaproteobacteria bacterium HGW-Gammaproteobacteria-10]|nr:MAG: hypothetical protein CVV06_06735 [Gammaproteobacteria bacterium HGW-Gammaproteobacteria-10]